jgi:hypothetical protein
VSVYSLHPAYEYQANVVAALEKRRGRSLEEWCRLVNEQGPAEESERRAWLKSAHGLGTTVAWIVSERAAGKGVPEQYDPETYVAAMFSGTRSGLRPIYDSLLELGRALGPDVRVCPCQTIVQFYRRHAIAEVKPSTRTRIDLGLALADLPLSGRLLDTGGLEKKNRITRRLPIASRAEIDDEVRHWFRVAYELDA